MCLSSLCLFSHIPMYLALAAIAAAHNDLSVQRDPVDVKATKSCRHCNEIWYLDLYLEKSGKAS